MRIREAIEMIDRLMPNQYGEEDKVHWLSELDGIADREVFRAHEREEDMGEFTGYPPGVDLDTSLMIPLPDEDIYRWYLEMKICDANGELTKYNNAAAKYNSYWQGFWNAYNQDHMPRQAATYFKL